MFGTDRFRGYGWISVRTPCAFWAACWLRGVLMDLSGRGRIQWLKVPVGKVFDVGGKGVWKVRVVCRGGGGG